MSNIFRIKIKKREKRAGAMGSPGGHEKKMSDPSGILMGSHVQIVGPTGGKEPKRKTASVTTPPDLSSPSHQVSE